MTPRKVVPLVIAVILAACNKDPPPRKADNVPPPTTPVPSDMVFNDFLPQGGGGQGLSVRMDGGLEAGLAETTEAVANGGEAAPAEDGKLRVTDPGAEPRAMRKYAFVTGRVDKRVLTMRQSANGPRGPQEVALAFTVELVPKQATPKGTHFEMKLLGIDLPDAQGAEKAAAAQQFAAFKGMTGGFDVSPRGEVGEVELKSDERMQSRMAQPVVQGLQQFAELILPIFPTAPIGVGAKWEAHEDKSEGGLKASSTRAYTLKEVTDQGGTVVSEITIDVPKAPLPSRPGQPQGTVQVTARGAYTYTFKFDHVSTKVDGQLETKQNLEIKGQPPISEVVKAKHLLELAK